MFNEPLKDEKYQNVTFSYRLRGPTSKEEPCFDAYFGDKNNSTEYKGRIVIKHTNN
jgi:hypothetical protein